MLEDGKIDGRQAVYLNIIFIIATALLSVPAITAAQAKQDAWISSIIAVLIGLTAAWLTVKLSSFYPQQTLIEYLPEITGRWPGKLLGLLYLVYFLHICSVMIREVGELLTEVFLTQTPLIVFHLIIVALGAFTIKQGLEVLARVNQVFLPLILLSVIVIFILLLPEMDPSRLLPVLDVGILNIFKGSIAPGAWNAEIIAFAMIIPFLKQPAEAGKIAYKSVLWIGLIFLYLIVGSLATFGPLISSFSFPVLTASRIINIGKFLDRPEPLIMAVWVTGGFAKITFFYYIIVLGGAQWLHLKDYRPLTLPVGVLLVSLSIAVGDNFLEIIHYMAHIFPFQSLIMGGAIPLCLIVIAVVRKKGGKGK